MPFLRALRTIAFTLVALGIFALGCQRCYAQAALLMEEPYGFFGALNPTGHTAVYFSRICAESPVELRRCRPGETGTVISRYQGVGGYDWVAMPIIPYLYSVERSDEIPSQVDRETVDRLRDNYHERHLLGLGEDIPRGNFIHGGWTELVGVAYERRIYAFRFATTEQQDDSFIALMNGRANRSRFQLIFNNCADFAREVLNFYFPRTFRRSFFPDAGMTTPKQIAYKLERYARRHPETSLQIFEIPQVPGYRRMSRANKNIAESLITTAYAIPIAVLNPYLAGGILVDYLIRGHYHIIPDHPQVLAGGRIDLLTAPDVESESVYAEMAPEESPVTGPDVLISLAATDPASITTRPYTGLDEIRIPHE